MTEKAVLLRFSNGRTYVMPNPVFADVLHMASNRLYDRQKEAQALLAKIDIGAEGRQATFDECVRHWQDAQTELDLVHAAHKTFSEVR